MKRKIQVIAPSNVVTGGAEALHDLSSRLTNLGFKSSIVYFPISDAPIPVAYKHFNLTKDSIIENSNDVVLVLPEVLTGLARNYSLSKIVIWWLSIDNYRQTLLSIKNFIRFNVQVFLGEKDYLWRLNNHYHISQSKFAYDFLQRHNIDSKIIYEPISELYYSNINLLRKRIKRVLYNPKKGFEYTSKVMQIMPETTFVALTNFSTIELIDLYQTSTIYIDFGNHPGRDRIPREAVLNGCCILTSRFGSADNYFDINIPDKYKFNLLSDDAFIKVADMIANINNDYHSNIIDFSNYNESIIQDLYSFDVELKNFFGCF